MTGEKIVRFAPINKDAMEYFLLNNPDFGKYNYEKQQKILFEQYYTYTGGFSKNMNEIGYESIEIVYDFEMLQKKWADENKITVNEENWQREVILQQIKKIKPDIVYWQGYPPLPQDIILKLKIKCPSIKLVLSHIGYPGPPEEIKSFDMVFAGYLELEKFFNSKGINTRLLYHGFNEDILQYVVRRTNLFNATFIGSSGFGMGGHAIRYSVLSELLKENFIQAWISEWNTDQSYEKPIKPALKTKSKIELGELFLKSPESIERKLKRLNNFLVWRGQIFFDNLQKNMSEIMSDLDSKIDQLSSRGGRFAAKYIIPNRKLSELFPELCHPPVHGLDMYNALFNSEITLHIGADPAIYRQSGAMRLFEATGVGTCLITDNADSLSDIFIPDKEIITYNSVKECKEKIKYFLENDDERKKIAVAGHTRTLKEHTIKNRCATVDSVIQELI